MTTGTSVVRHKNERGAALFFFALSAGVILIILALVLDVGWAQYAGRRAQTAADTAAMAAVSKALESLNAGVEATCGGDIACQAATACAPNSSNLGAGCLYAKQGGFTHGGDHGRQRLTIAANFSENAPGVSGIPVTYWVQSTAEQSSPQWFSALFANEGITAAAQATAAVRREPAGASLHLLNRTNDCFVSALYIGLICGSDFLSVGGNEIKARGGIYMASSNKSGLGLPKIAAGTVLGHTTVEAPFTRVMGDGGIQSLLGLGSYDWDSAPANGFPDNGMFSDPMAGKGQPPPPTGLPNRPVVGGLILGSLNPATPTVLPPGNYYSVTPPLLLLPSRPTGLPVIIQGNVVFSDGQPTPCGGFCNYVFYGGVVTGVLSSVTFAPGRYVFAGAQPVAGGPGVGLTLGANSKIKDLTPLSGGEITRNTDAGEIFIFTDAQYPGLVLPADLASSGLSFPQVRAGITASLGSEITLHGLNADSADLPSELKPFAPIVIWQDQANTSLVYKANGTVDTSCGGACTKILSVPGSQEMVLTALKLGGNPGTNLYGTVYGPRGSYLTVVGLLPGDVIAGPLQFITGALQMAVNAGLDLKPLPNPPSKYVASLIR